LLKEFGKPIAAPSANRFGRVSPTTAAHVHEDLGDDIDLVLEGGPSEVGIESTIVDLSSGEAVILRPGKISAAELGIKAAARSAVRHSGGMEKHYAPRTPARLVPTHDLDREIAKLETRAAVLAFSRPDERVDFWLRMPREPAAYAQKLYAALRELDGARCDAILIEAPPAEPGWEAVLDRLRKATAP
jgi:L-threonylcarbamoyladenylate synthase